eukprot:CAMPEP_0197264016 /NCGR_PEP_ID=MMETSP1432-20130617/1541_1 /TAXON_ID=44447 /ORGANISM="Pseudo-nitzschia delicatissima, Strain UNC1205" /LENGTH=300 /DNA_ID=CAMNT_0042728609 /DNA_START=57 /DNA_END=959 /DNA_ORIENTATION=-
MGSSGDEEAIIHCGTTKGDITLQLIREWSPNGYDKAVALFERHFYDNSHFFRAVPNFLVQFGISYSEDKELQHFAKTSIQDDPKHDPPIEFHPGIISYAGSGPNSRTSQLFFSYGSSKSLGTQLWETPIGKVIEGMDNAKDFHSYGDMPPWGKGPVQGKIYNGPQYIEENFPLIDKFSTCTVKRSGALEAKEEVDPDHVDDDIEGGDGDGDGDGDDGSGDEGNAEAEESEADDEAEEELEVVAVAANQKEAKVELRRLGAKSALRDADSHGLVVPAVMFVVLIIFFLSLRGRKKETGKMN